MHLTALRPFQRLPTKDFSMLSMRNFQTFSLPSLMIYIINKFKLVYGKKHAQNTITNSITINTYDQLRISFFKDKVHHVFIFQIILLPNQQLHHEISTG